MFVGLHREGGVAPGDRGFEQKDAKSAKGLIFLAARCCRALAVEHDPTLRVGLVETALQAGRRADGS
jgi:hypothetical protein